MRGRQGVAGNLTDSASITHHLLGQAGLKPDEDESGALTLIQRFGSSANLNEHLSCLVLDGVYRRSAEGSATTFRLATG